MTHNASVGLTSAEVAERVAAGRTNAVDDSSSRSLAEIFRSNVFNRFNAILGAMLVVVLVAGSVADALFGIVLVVNSSVGVVQEYLAKRKLDRLALMHAPVAHVVRDGQLMQVAIADVVIDDLVEVSSGDQVPADGRVVESHGLEINQSNLTGEADSIPKSADDEVMSATIVTAGRGRFVVHTVGADAYAHRIAAEAKTFSKTKSEITESTNRLLRYLSWLLVVAVPLQLWSQFRVYGSDAWRDAVVGSVAGIVGLVPEGLVLLTTVAFLSAAVKLARQQVLVQELPAVESLARVSVVCLDKTGTLTTGDMRLEKIELVGTDDDATVRRALAALATVGPLNGTLTAIEQEVGRNTDWVAEESVPFSSARKWSGTSFGADGDWVLGAPEMLLSQGHGIFDRIGPHTAEARRVVLVARVDRLAPEVGDMTVTAAALVVLSECIRDDAAETLRFFREQGVSLKIISGDNPSTVAAIARSVGFEVEGGADMRDVGDTADEVLEVVTAHSVFGRVSPQQKRSMVQALQSCGEVVAMTGDGVNDVLALKQADIGVAMENGAPATKAVAQMILLDGRFSRLPSVLAEGRRVIANVERVANLFIVKNAMSLLSIVMAAVFVVKYPFLPRHLTMISTLTIGIPSFFLALAPNNRRYVPGFLKRVLSFSLPAGVLTGMSALVASWVNSTWFDTTGNVSCAVTGAGNLVRSCWQGGSAATLAAMIVFVWILTNLAHPINGWKTVLISSIIGCAVVAFLFDPVATALRLSLPWQLVVWSAVVGACGAAGIEILHRLSNKSR